jgi:hypothetical protein
MYKKVAILTSCLAAMGLLFGATLARAADDEGGGIRATAAEMSDICKDQAAKLNLTGTEADDYIKQCTAPTDSVERSATPDEKMEGQAQPD